MNITTAHRSARNQASIDLADAGAAASSIKLYTAEGGTLLGTRTLAKPCGTINGAGRIVLQLSAAQEMVAADGIATWAEWCDGDGTPIATGAVTDETGAGPWILEGAAGTQVYAGGVIGLSATALIG